MLPLERELRSSHEQGCHVTHEDGRELHSGCHEQSDRQQREPVSARGGAPYRSRRRKDHPPEQRIGEVLREQGRCQGQPRYRHTQQRCRDGIPARTKHNTRHQENRYRRAEEHQHAEDVIDSQRLRTIEHAQRKRQ